MGKKKESSSDGSKAVEKWGKRKRQYNQAQQGIPQIPEVILHLFREEGGEGRNPSKRGSVGGLSSTK